MPIFTRKYIADAVAAARLDDVEHRTDRAIHLVAFVCHLTDEQVAEIARDEAHAEVLAETAVEA